MKVSARLICLFCLTVIGWAMFGGWSDAQTVKAPFSLTGRVMDRANMLSSGTETRLTQKLAAHEAKSGNQVVVVTIASLGGTSLEDYSLSLARGWQLGQKDLDNGVLLLVAKNDRKLRIEVGYGLEGTLTDAIASLIIRDTITPAFKKGSFDRGIASGVDQIVQVLESNQAALDDWKQRAKTSSYDQKTADKLIFFGFVAIWIVLFFGSWIMGWLATKFGRKIKPGHYRWLGFDGGPNAPKPKRSRSSSYGGTIGGGGFGGGGGGFSGGGGGFGGGGSSGGW